MVLRDVSVTRSFAISPNLRRRVYGYGMQQTGGDEAFDIVWSRYQRADGAERDNLAYCLAQTNRIWLIRRSQHHSNFLRCFHEILLVDVQYVRRRFRVDATCRLCNIMVAIFK